MSSQPKSELKQVHFDYSNRFERQLRSLVVYGLIKTSRPIILNIGRRVTHPLKKL